MREPIPSDASFPTAHCEVCGRTVLTYVTLGDDGQENRCCVHCDTPAVAIRWVGAGELETEGYGFGTRAAVGGGCGSGCGSCAVRRN